MSIKIDNSFVTTVPTACLIEDAQALDLAINSHDWEEVAVVSDCLKTVISNCTAGGPFKPSASSLLAMGAAEGIITDDGKDILCVQGRPVSEAMNGECCQCPESCVYLARHQCNPERSQIRLSKEFLYEPLTNPDVLLPFLEKLAEKEEQDDKLLLPCPEITQEELVSYGYTYFGMLPLTQEKALELAKQDVPVYLLYNDNTEALAQSFEEIRESSDVMFGVAKEDWAEFLSKLQNFSTKRTMFVLNETVEREISEPEFFYTFNAARKAMAERFATVVDIPEEDRWQCNAASFQCDAGEVLTDTAYAERHGQNFDWKISEVEV